MGVIDCPREGAHFCSTDQSQLLNSQFLGRAPPCIFLPETDQTLSLRISQYFFPLCTTLPFRLSGDANNESRIFRRFEQAQRGPSTHSTSNRPRIDQARTVVLFSGNQIVAGCTVWLQVCTTLYMCSPRRGQGHALHACAPDP